MRRKFKTESLSDGGSTASASQRIVPVPHSNSRILTADLINDEKKQKKTPTRRKHPLSLVTDCEWLRRSRAGLLRLTHRRQCSLGGGGRQTATGGHIDDDLEIGAQ